ncbi:MAG TPA: hypothetical protein VKY66_08565 [Protaetiibacter sp.]|nr:hypothetical protein [Protaetiibacter sp.]
MDVPPRIAAPRRGALPLAWAVSLAFVLAGCVALPELGGASSEGTAPQAEPPAVAGEEPDESTEDGPRTQEESCDWDAPKLTAGASSVPQGSAGELQSIIVGAWQHTHFDTGGGYEPVTADIRYVFPSTQRILYCQHVEGVTNHAENAADISWDDTRIVVPGGAPGWVVLSWDADTMVWLNRADDSHYLLQRR